MILEWTPDLSVGLESVDRQHQELFRRIFRLIEATMNGEGKREVTETLNFLGEYVVEHFRSEEELMRDRGYPDLDMHVKIHRRFEKDVSALKQDLLDGKPDDKFVLKVQNNVVNWLIHHIRIQDKRIGDYVRSKQEMPVESS